MTTERKEKFTPGPWKAHTTQHADWVTTDWKDCTEQINICDCGKHNGWNDVYVIAAAPEMYGSNEAALTEIDKIIPALLKTCRLCDKIFDGPRICSVCAECDTQRAVHAARTMRQRLTNLQRKARGEE